MEYQFIIWWSQDGLEGIVPIDQSRFLEDMVLALADEKPTYENELGQIVHMMKLRAKANSQRHYEIYLLKTVDIDEEQLQNLFEKDPQIIVNAIREKGVKIYGIRAKAAPVII